MTPEGPCGRPRVPVPPLMLVTDSSDGPVGARLRGRALSEAVRAAVEGGANMVQVREKALSHDELVVLAAHLRRAIDGRALLLVNGDVDAAAEAGADGVHLPADGISIAEARARGGDGLLISRAVHGFEEAAAAEREGADVIVLGTVFRSASHPGGRVIGVEGVRAACAGVHVPLLAIGGVTAANAGEVMRAGASGVAVIGAIFDAEDAREAARALRAAIDSAWREA